jgi:transposase
MNKLAMSSCCEFCTQTAYAVRTVICSQHLKRLTVGGDQSFPMSAVGSVARSSTCSPRRSSPRPAIAVPRSSKSCAASRKAPPLSTWPMNWPSIALISWNDGTRSTHLWPRIFPPTMPLSDPVTEADELYQNAKQKGRKHADPADPPRRRANQARGHGTWASDRPPIVGVVGRCSGQIRLRLCRHSDRATLQPLLLTHTRDDAIVNTDEWSAYRTLAATGRIHQTVCHTPTKREWARDDDGDGIRSSQQHDGRHLDRLSQFRAFVSWHQQMVSGWIHCGI